MNILRIFLILKSNKNYYHIYLGQFISFIGTMITSLAITYQVYELTNSTLMVGLMSLLQLLPLLCTALIGGSIADKYHRRKLLIVTEIILSIGILILAMNTFNSYHNILLLFIIAPLITAVTGLHRPALDSLTQQIVPKEELVKASSLNGIKMGFGAMLGPAIGGILIASLGLFFTYIVDFFTFAISLYYLLRITNIPAPIVTEHNISIVDSIKKGLNYAKSRQELVGSYSVDFVAMVFGMPIALFPAIAKTLGGAEFLGMLTAAPAVGALIASIFSSFTYKIKRHGSGITYSAILWGSAIVLFGIVDNLYLKLFFLMCAGGFDTISAIFRSTMWNESIPNNYRGRLAGIEMISYLSGPKLGDFEAGVVAKLAGIDFSIISGGILCILGVGWIYWKLPDFRNYNSPIKAKT